jgi:predicted membrane metal-binding protein
MSWVSDPPGSGQAPTNAGVGFKKSTNWYCILCAILRGLYEKFNLTGTSHIIVISGSNISLIAGILLLLGQKLVGKRSAPPLAIIGILIYTSLVGADAAVSRAAVMGLVWVIAI